MRNTKQHRNTHPYDRTDDRIRDGKRKNRSETLRRKKIRALKYGDRRH